MGQKVAEKLSLSVGDVLEIQNTDLRTLTATVSGIFDNYVDNFIMLSAETYRSAFGDWQANTALLNVSGDTEETAEALTSLEAVSGVSRLSVTRENIDVALSCLNYIIWLIVFFSGALAFIVIYNLTNINLAERSREIATCCGKIWCYPCWQASLACRSAFCSIGLLCKWLLLIY